MYKIQFLFYSIQGSIDSLNEIIAIEKAQWSELDEQLLSLKQDCNVLNTKLHELSPEVSFLEEEYSRLHQLVSLVL